jgi:protein-tyrosine phosphatase
VAVVVGVLVREGHAPDTEAAMALVNRVRPSARLSGPQRRFMRAMVG